MEQNRVRTYTLYAIGEILLVVVGILIALQVNNWNEARIETNLKNWYITAIQSDISANISEMQRIGLTASQDSLEHVALRNRLLSNDGNLDTVKVILKTMNKNLVAFREITSPSLETLLNSGDLDLFTSSIREELIHLKTTTNEYLKINDLAFQLYRDAFGVYAEKFGAINDNDQLGVEFEEMIWESIPPSDLLVMTKQLLHAKINFHQVGYSIRKDYKQVAETFLKETGKS